ncbi:MAG TPA: glycosyltransferase family 2 protein [Chloroflexota bacterium]|nr:glycosyltransferase family 2 protein [Chloroflexota bacterium]
MNGAALVIPAWNEPEAIGAVLDEVPAGSVDDVFVVVGSVDDSTASVAVAHGATALVQARPGYGAACWTGAQAALANHAHVLAFLDGDYSDPPNALPRILEPLHTQQADLVLGVRDLRQYPNALPVHARAGNGIVRWLMHRAISHRYADLPSFKAIRADALRALDMHEMTYGWTVEMLVKAARAELRVTEVAVGYRPRLGGRSKVAGSLHGSFSAGAKLLACTLAYSTWRPDRPPHWSVASGQ